MLKFELVQTDKHSTNNLLRRKNLRFLRRANLIKLVVLHTDLNLNMNENIIFIGGIHGVGKGTLCKKLSEKYSLKHLSASEVLKWNEISTKYNKKVKNFESTQTRLISGLKKIITRNETYLLDGHFCLLNKNGNPEKISEETFLKIRPKAIIVMTEDIDVIIDRLKGRDDSKYNYNTLSKMQDLELNYSKEISLKLKVPHINIVNGDYSFFSKFLKSYENIN